MTNPTSTRITLLVLLAAFAFAPAHRLQAQGTDLGTIRGNVMDASGAGVPNASVTITDAEITELPRDSRDYTSFLYLNPSITQAQGEGTFKYLGAQSYGASYSLDGQRSNGGVFGDPTTSQPSLEAIGELTVLANSFT